MAGGPIEIPSSGSAGGGKAIKSLELGMSAANRADTPRLNIAGLFIASPILELIRLYNTGVSTGFINNGVVYGLNGTIGV